MRQVFRREVGEEDFKLVGSITDSKKSTFLDTSRTEDLSNLVLDGEPQLMKSTRTFTISLKNVGEIRPPAITSPAPSSSSGSNTSGNTTGDTTDNSSTDNTDDTTEEA